MTLRRKLYLGLALAALLPAGLVAALHSVTYMRNAEATAKAHSLNLVQGAAQAIDLLMQNAERDMHAIATAVLREGVPPDEISRRFATYTYVYPYFEEILWVSPQGNVLASSDLSNAGRSIRNLHDELADNLAMTLREPSGTVYVSDLDDISASRHADVEAGRVKRGALRLQLLLRADDRHGKALGVLVGRLTNQAIVVDLEDLKQRAPGAEAAELLNHAGLLLMSSDAQAPLLGPHALAGRIATERDSAGGGLAQFEAEMAGRKREITVAETAGIGATLGASWQVVLTQSPEAVRGPLREALLRTAALLAIIVAAGWFFGILLTRSIVRPVESLAATAARIGGGDLAARAQVRSDDEIGQLAHAFNRMADSLALDRVALTQVNEELEQRVLERTTALAQLEALNRQARLLAEMSSLLQSCRDLEEAATVVARFGPQAFQRGAGAVYFFQASRNYLEQLAAWGEPVPAAGFAPAQCWALRLGRVHRARGDEVSLPCAHARAEAEAALCVPLIAQDNEIGLLHLEAGTGTERLAQAVAEQLSLALSNLMLRETLHNQSIRDGLTGLHNRRYLEESLEREIAVAKRSGTSLAVFMLDADHFKRFNDQYGHEAGDEVLRAIGLTLRNAVRAGDLACRFGGEEFTVVLAGSDEAGGREWAARLTADLRRLEVKHAGITLPPITVSMGLAVYPAHGADPETLLQAADLALYDAKHAGRDRFFVAGDLAPHKTGVT